MQSPEKVHGWVAPITFFCQWTKIHHLFKPNVGRVVDDLLFRFSSCPFTPKIFAIKVERCQKSRGILDVFALQILWSGPTKRCTQIITSVSWHVTWKRFVMLLPPHTSTKYTGAHTLNFKPNLFKCSPLQFLEDPVPVWGVSCWQVRLIQRCLSSDSYLVRFISYYGMYFGRMLSPTGRNVFLCCSQFRVFINDVMSLPVSHIYRQGLFQHPELREGN